MVSIGTLEGYSVGKFTSSCFCATDYSWLTGYWNGKLGQQKCKGKNLGLHLVLVVDSWYCVEIDYEMHFYLLSGGVLCLFMTRLNHPHKSEHGDHAPIISDQDYQIWQKS